MTRENLEQEWNYQATFENTRNARIDCLMRTNNNRGYYWNHVDYEGLFAYGGTSNFNASFLRYAMDNGILKLVAGTLPEGLLDCAAGL